ncbi:Pfs- NACHT and Ankyrin domain protein [Apiospora kogelbergensis]|uniref:Pfs- NACHT and Ankyrin domain protein n=1 Tax=Apiospora kogelbergensis TaxID=1337665 RepID=UPI0031303EC8
MMYPFQPVQQSLMDSLQWLAPSVAQRHCYQTLTLYTQIVLTFFLFYYIASVIRYHWTHWSKAEAQVPPLYPSLIPFIGNFLHFLLDNEGLFRRVTSYKGDWAAARVSVPGQSVYLFQDRETIRNIWKAKSLQSPISVSTYIFKFFLGVPEPTIEIYRADISGPYRKPHPASTPMPPKKRVDYLSHQEFLRALSGSGLKPLLQRFKRALEMHVDGDLGPLAGDEWTELGSFRRVIRPMIAEPLIESIFGPAILRLNPGFTDDLFEFDANIPWLVRGIPSFIMPRPHRVRKRLASQIRKWQEYASSHFEESSIYDDGDGDPFWGSQFIRNRRSVFKNAGGHDVDAIVALDLGLCFGLVANTSPATLLAAWHIFKDPSLLQRVRGELTDIPLLQSIYAETLRLYNKIYIMVSSPHTDVPLGRWRLPRNSIGLLNSSISHRDPDVWNTRDGRYPVDAFWADRFLIDPQDPASGPINPAIREAQDHNRRRRSADAATEERPFFSMDGLEASWFPYGGGFSICPGRHMAKASILYTCALLAHEFDIEFLTGSLVFDNWRSGLGIQETTNDLRFRIRKREEIL